LVNLPDRTWLEDEESLAALDMLREPSGELPGEFLEEHAGGGPPPEDDEDVAQEDLEGGRTRAGGGSPPAEDLDGGRLPRKRARRSLPAKEEPAGEDTGEAKEDLKSDRGKQVPPSPRPRDLPEEGKKQWRNRAVWRGSKQELVRVIETRSPAGQPPGQILRCEVTGEEIDCREFQEATEDSPAPLPPGKLELRWGEKPTTNDSAFLALAGGSGKKGLWMSKALRWHVWEHPSCPPFAYRKHVDGWESRYLSEVERDNVELQLTITLGDEERSLPAVAFKAARPEAGCRIFMQAAQLWDFVGKEKYHFLRYDKSRRQRGFLNQLNVYKGHVVHDTVRMFNEEGQLGAFQPWCPTGLTAQYGSMTVYVSLALFIALLCRQAAPGLSQRGPHKRSDEESRKSGLLIDALVKQFCPKIFRVRLQPLRPEEAVFDFKHLAFGALADRPTKTMCIDEGRFRVKDLVFSKQECGLQGKVTFEEVRFHGKGKLCYNTRWKGDEFASFADLLVESVSAQSARWVGLQLVKEVVREMEDQILYGGLGQVVGTVPRALILATSRRAIRNQTNAARRVQLNAAGTPIFTQLEQRERAAREKKSRTALEVARERAMYFETLQRNFRGERLVGCAPDASCLVRTERLHSPVMAGAKGITGWLVPTVRLVSPDRSSQYPIRPPVFKKVISFLIQSF
jgi:hypothetical protein